MANQEKDKQETRPLASAPKKQATAKPAEVEKASSVCAKKNERTWGTKGLVFLVILLILMVTAGFIVPVGKLPLLRNIVWMMGYSSQDTQHISLLKALFYWGDKASLRASISADQLYSVFDRSGANASQLGVGGPQSGLIDIRAVNDSLARSGQKEEQLSGRVIDLNEPGAKASGVMLAKEGALSAATQANVLGGQEVFFGSEEANVSRDKNDGFDSVSSLQKNRDIIGAQKTDWLDALADKASLMEVNDLDRKIGANGQVGLTNLSSMGNLGKGKPVRDLNFAWLLGRAARRSTKPVLRKTLASASWNGAELPKKIFDVSGSSGLGIDPDSVVGDIGEVKSRIEQEEECEHSSEGEGAVIREKMDEAITLIRGLGGSFPGGSCDNAALDAWAGQISTVETKCKESSVSYNRIASKCRFSISKHGSCEAGRLRDMVAQQKQTCQEMLVQAQRLADEAAAPNPAPPVDPATLNPAKGVGEVQGTGFDQSVTQTEVNRQFNASWPEKDEGKSNTGDGFFTNPGGAVKPSNPGATPSEDPNNSGEIQSILGQMLEPWKKS